MTLELQMDSPTHTLLLMAFTSPNVSNKKEVNCSSLILPRMAIQLINRWHPHQIIPPNTHFKKHLEVEHLLEHLQQLVQHLEDPRGRKLVPRSVKTACPKTKARTVSCTLWGEG